MSLAYNEFRQTSARSVDDAEPPLEAVDGMSAQPVLLIHGVGQRGNAPGFADLAIKLQTRMDPDQGSIRFVPVFWGDLAGNPDYILDSLPDVDDPGIRSAVPMGSPEFAAVLLDDDGATELSQDEAIDLVTDRALAGAGPRELWADPAPREEVRDAIAAAWVETTTLQYVSDPAVLEAVGDVLAEMMADGQSSGDLRLSHEAEDVRSLLGRRAADAGRSVGLIDKMLGRYGGRLNHNIRSKFGPNFVGFFGDIIAYSQRRAEIHQRIWDRVQEHADGYGTASQPIGVVAHSLGGLAMFDLVVAEDKPLHVSTLVTFGSQAPFFHAMAPRSTILPEYEGSVLTLPPTIGRWLNLWEPLDFLAFVAKRMFRLSDGTCPEDRMVPYERSSKVWTHSVYWERPELDVAVKDAFM